MFPRSVIYLPFCLHCFKEVLATFEILKDYYNISFLRKRELRKVALWTGTQSIDARRMQTIFGKQVDQEEVYCTFNSRDIYEAMEDSRVTNETLNGFASTLEDFQEIRFIVLKVLPTMLPNRVTRSKKVIGSFLGLTSPPKVKRGLVMLPNPKLITPARAPPLTPQRPKTARKCLAFDSPGEGDGRKRRRATPSPQQSVKRKTLSRPVARATSLLLRPRELALTPTTLTTARNFLSFSSPVGQKVRKRCRAFRPLPFASRTSPRFALRGPSPIGCESLVEDLYVLPHPNSRSTEPIG
jgi:hypothetical protein